MTSRIGILGRGALGSALARSFRAAGYQVVAAGSSVPAESAAASAADVVILAIPRGRLRTVAPGSLAGRLVVDATNYWWERDGLRPDLEDPLTSTSETVQRWLGDARVVKAFGHVSVWELENLGRPLGHPERRAIAVAGDHQHPPLCRRCRRRRRRRFGRAVQVAHLSRVHVGPAGQVRGIRHRSIIAGGATPRRHITDA